MNLEFGKEDFALDFEYKIFLVFEDNRYDIAYGDTDIDKTTNFKSLERDIFNKKEEDRIEEAVREYLDQRYENIHLFGRGGFSRVVSGYEKNEQVGHAIKIIDLGRLGRGESLNLIKREVTNMERCKHKYILNLERAVWEVQGFLLIITILCDSTLLSVRVENRRREYLGYLGDLAEGVAYLHSIDIVHRDIKPANILIRREREGNIIQVGDFGLTKCIMDESTKSTQRGGTWNYMPHEWVMPESRDDRLNPSGDNWALGVMIYEILENTSPFDYGEENVNEVRKRLKRCHYTPLLPRNQEWEGLIQSIFRVKEERLKAYQIGECIREILRVEGNVDHVDVGDINDIGDINGDGKPKMSIMLSGEDEGSNQGTKGNSRELEESNSSKLLNESSWSWSNPPSNSSSDPASSNQQLLSVEEKETQIDRALGAMFGSLIGDAFGAPFEFTPNKIYKQEVKSLLSTKKLPPRSKGNPPLGQISDSELSLSLAHALLKGHGHINILQIARFYAKWIQSPPFRSNYICIYI